MSHSYIHKILKDKAVKYTGNTRLFCGLRFVAFSGDLFRAVDTERVVDEFFTRLFRKLPKDAQIVEHSGIDDPFFWGISMNGQYMDERLILLSSCEWSRIEDGAEIPKLDISFKDILGIAKFATYKPQWYWRLYIWGAERAVKWFPKWVRY